MPTRKEQAAMTRKKIISVAEQMISQKGYENIHVADIAAACQMSSGNFYHYFKSLDALFYELDSVKFYEPFSSLQESSSAPISARLESYILDWVQAMLTLYGSSYMYYWTRHYTLKAASPESENRFSLIVGHLVQLLEQGIARGELRADTPIKALAHTIAFSLFGCSGYFGITGDEQLIRQWAAEFAGALLQNGLAPYLVSSRP